jgi:hypothetical protein
LKKSANGRSTGDDAREDAGSWLRLAGQAEAEGSRHDVEHSIREWPLKLHGFLGRRRHPHLASGFGRQEQISPRKSIFGYFVTAEMQKKAAGENRSTFFFRFPTRATSCQIDARHARVQEDMAMTREFSLQDASHDAFPLPAPSLVRGEDGATYDQVAARFTAAVAPENVIEEMWVRDVVDLVWDVLRLRRLKAGLFTIGASDGMAAILRAIGEQYDVNARDWAARKPGAVAAVNTQLSAAGLDISDVTTSTFAARIDQFERIERMLAAAEVRRAAALAAIDNRRVAERLRAAALAAERAAAPPIEDGEFALVPDGGPA